MGIELDLSDIEGDLREIKGEISALRALMIQIAYAQGLLPFPIGAVVVPAREDVRPPETRISGDLYEAVFRASITQAVMELTVIDYSRDLKEFRCDLGWCKTEDYRVK